VKFLETWYRFERTIYSMDIFMGGDCKKKDEYKSTEEALQVFSEIVGFEDYVELHREKAKLEKLYELKKNIDSGMADIQRDITDEVLSFIEEFIDLAIIIEIQVRVTNHQNPKRD
jgi:hypothetical protein